VPIRKATDEAGFAAGRLGHFLLATTASRSVKRDKTGQIRAKIGEIRTKY